VFEQIRAVEPDDLFVVADGPRADHPEDKQRIEETRAIVEDVDWGCDVRRLYADQNLGIGRRIPTGLDAVFDEVDRAIILEDDCVPDRSFFRFCQLMLEVYSDDDRVMDVSGSNHLGTWKPEKQDYHFSTYGGIWGWATWRRAWNLYEAEMEPWGDPEIRDRVRDYIADDRQFEYVRRIYQSTYEGKIETWDYQWGFTRSINWGLSVVPARNLVSNVGFGDGATNTTDTDSPLANISRHSMDFPLDIRDYVGVDRDYDERYYRISNSQWERNPILRSIRDVYYRFFDI
jgi:hypothetical protein